MDNSEFSNTFDVLYNNITSNQAPGLNEYEKSVFLTKAQDEIVKSYFNPRLNKTQEGFDGNERRQIDFSMIIGIKSYTIFNDAIFDVHDNSKRITINDDIMFFINEFVDVQRRGKVLTESSTYKNALMFQGLIGLEEIREDHPPIGSNYEILYNKKLGIFVAFYRNEQYRFWDETDMHKANDFYNEEDPETFTYKAIQGIYLNVNSNELYKIANTGNFALYSNVRLTAVPIQYNEFSRRMQKPFKRPLQYQAWRLLDNSNNAKSVELIVGPQDTICSYSFRYVKRPRPIIVGDIDGLTINGVGYDESKDCELDPILHEEILQRAVELAKASWEGSLNSQIALGQNSETNMGVIPQARQ